MCAKIRSMPRSEIMRFQKCVEFWPTGIYGPPYVGLISFGIQVTESLVKFYTSYKGLDTDVARTPGNLENLLDTFKFL